MTNQIGPSDQTAISDDSTESLPDVASRSNKCDAMLSVTVDSAIRNIVTIAVEDWFHVASFHKYIDTKHWDRFESRLENAVFTTLDLLDHTQTQATFFTLGWIAERLPEHIRGNPTVQKAYLGGAHL